MNPEQMEDAGPYLRRFFDEPTNVWFYYHLCPACDMVHQILVGIDRQGYGWVFNDDTAKPTFSPSMRVEAQPPLLKMVGSDDVHLNRTICHYDIIEGQISFINDSHHALAGKIVAMPQWPKKK